MILEHSNKKIRKIVNNSNISKENPNHININKNLNNFYNKLDNNISETEIFKKSNKIQRSLNNHNNEVSNINKLNDNNKLDYREVNKENSNINNPNDNNKLDYKEVNKDHVINNQNLLKQKEINSSNNRDNIALNNKETKAIINKEIKRPDLYNKEAKAIINQEIQSPKVVKNNNLKNKRKKGLKKNKNIKENKNNVKQEDINQSESEDFSDNSYEERKLRKKQRIADYFKTHPIENLNNLENNIELSNDSNKINPDINDEENIRNNNEIILNMNNLDNNIILSNNSNNTNHDTFDKENLRNNKEIIEKTEIKNKININESISENLKTNNSNFDKNTDNLLYKSYSTKKKQKSKDKTKLKITNIQKDIWKNNTTNQKIKDTRKLELDNITEIKKPIHYCNNVYEYNNKFHMYGISQNILDKYKTNLSQCLKKIEEFKTNKYYLYTDDFGKKIFKNNISRFDERIYYKKDLDKFIPVFELYNNNEQNLLNYYKKNAWGTYNINIKIYKNCFNEDLEDIALIRGDEDFEFETNKKNEKTTRKNKPIYCIICKKFINFKYVSRHLKDTHNDLESNIENDNEIKIPKLIEIINNKINMINITFNDLEKNIEDLIKLIKSNYEFIEGNHNLNSINIFKNNVYILQNYLNLTTFQDFLEKFNLNETQAENGKENNINKYIIILNNLFNKEKFFEYCEKYNI